MDVHAEKLVSAGEDLLKQIHEMRLNLLLQQQERELERGAKKTAAGEQEEEEGGGRAEDGVAVVAPREEGDR